MKNKTLTPAMVMVTINNKKPEFETKEDIINYFENHKVSKESFYQIKSALINHYKYKFCMGELYSIPTDQFIEEEVYMLFPTLKILKDGVDDCEKQSTIERLTVHLDEIGVEDPDYQAKLIYTIIGDRDE